MARLDSPSSSGEAGRQSMSYFVYILKSLIANKTYAGYTNNLDKRILEHNTGKSFFTRRYKPWKLLYSEKIDDKETAIRKEKYLKSTAGRRWMKKVFFSS